ncbi:exonuclease 3'-5' domain-containing protein 2-like [Anopheles bellator]|uniref:exonuclease 3'-5' domain-containing protein 2-like n=1 Tax=Anopheles bellator TaxID=139047 RepID=UPI00264A48E8|nr:exonuclease 3'-5' domain-containing protein 2-like [Anopheles bellator]
MGEQRMIFNRGGPLGRQEIRVISTAAGCRRIVNRLYQDCQDCNVLGFDCEWETYQGHRQPVSVLQLASPHGFCAVIRLSKINNLPWELQSLLMDRSIFKVGVATSADASKLLQDYGLEVRGCCDLRFLAERIGLTQRSLAGLAEETLSIIMVKDWRVSSSHWDAAYLSEEQIRYAADDAYIGALVFEEIFRYLGHHDANRMTVWLDKPYPHHN